MRARKFMGTSAETVLGARTLSSREDVQKYTHADKISMRGKRFP